MRHLTDRSASGEPSSGPPRSAQPSPRRPQAARRRLLLRSLALLLAMVALAAGLGCREQVAEAPQFEPFALDTAGPPRGFLLGFSSLPANLTDEAYTAAFDRAAHYGEALLLQRGPEWDDFMPGGSVSEALREATAREVRALEVRDLEAFVALDVFDPGRRGRLAGAPPDREDATLADEALRSAFIAEARFIALNYRPRFLALGVEVNATYEQQPAQFDAYVEAYREAYAAVKEVSPETLVFPTFQYEQFMGVVPWEPPHPPRWELLDAFEGQIDAFAITTFPSFAYQVARKVPPLYYQQIAEHTDLPVIFAAAGFASAPGRDNLNSSTAAEQRRYLQRLVEDADAMGSPLLVWFAGADPAYATEPPQDLLFSIGLRTSDDVPKEAWTVWVDAARRPYDPAAAAGDRADEDEADTAGSRGD